MWQDIGRLQYILSIIIAYVLLDSFLAILVYIEVFHVSHINMMLNMMDTKMYLFQFRVKPICLVFLLQSALNNITTQNKSYLDFILRFYHLIIKDQTNSLKSNLNSDGANYKSIYP